MLKRVLIKRPMLRKLLSPISRLRFRDSSAYWERRYQAGGDSGSGSYGRLANFKADFLNNFVDQNDIHSVLEFGCGDGHQLGLANYKSYIGVDISSKAVEICKNTFANDDTKNFYTSTNFDGSKADLVLSLDVIYHLVEDNAFEKYIANVFTSSNKFVVIYSSDFVGKAEVHVRHRKFTRFIEENVKNFNLIHVEKNKYPFNPKYPDNTSLADFFIYEKI